MGGTLLQVIIHRKSEKILKRLHGDVLDRIRRAIRSLASEPRPVGYKKMAGYNNLYRIRVGDWRIIYAPEDNNFIVLVLEVTPRGRAYRNF